jgi:ADP-ribose pyrophosphatase YjhB (NUDIX family)
MILGLLAKFEITLANAGCKTSSSGMRHRSPRLAARAIIVNEARLLLVNAYPKANRSDLWCAPGGGVTIGTSLPDNLAREVHEETGLTVSVGALALVNEFHDPSSGFHQVELFFRCQIINGELQDEWRDPEGIVTSRRFFTLAELRTIRLKPDSLPDVAFGASGPALYDQLERIVP